jgi:hypothetical protein
MLSGEGMRLKRGIRGNLRVRVGMIIDDDYGFWV